MITEGEAHVLIDRVERALSRMEIVADAVQSCKSHCWVEGNNRAEAKRFVATFLVACAGACFGTLLGR
jgi:hypothetical protein